MYDLKDMKQHILDGQASEVIAGLSEEEISPGVAKDLFLFLYDYTNSFKNANTSPDLLMLAGKTIESSIGHDKLIVERLRQSLTRMKHSSLAIANLELFLGGAVAGTFIPYDPNTSHLMTSNDWRGFLRNLLITIIHVELCFLLIERSDGSWEILIDTKSGKDIQGEMNLKLKAENGIVRTPKRHETIIRKVLEIWEKRV